MQWFGHIQRCPGRPTDAVFDFGPEADVSRHPQGKPRTRWMDTITKDLQHLGLSLAEAIPIALDRYRRRVLVNWIGSTHDATSDIEQEN